MMRGGGQAGEKLAARLAHSLSTAKWDVRGYGVVLLRPLPGRSAARSPDEAVQTSGARAELLELLAEWARGRLRAEDELLHEPQEGLAVLVRGATPAAALLVAERLRDGLGAPTRPRGRRAGSGSTRAEPAPVAGEAHDAARIRLGLGYASATGGDDDPPETVIRAAWRPRMLLSVSPTTLLASARRAGASAPLRPSHAAPAASGLTVAGDLPRRSGSRPEAFSPGAPAPHWPLEPLADLGWLAAGGDVAGERSPLDAALDGPDGPDGDRARREPETSGARRLRLVPREGLSEHEFDALRRRSSYLGVPYIRLSAQLDADVRGTLPAALARELRAVPVGRNRFVLTVAMENPTDANALLRLRAETGLAIFPVLAAAVELDHALAQME